MSGRHRDASWWWPLAEARRDLICGVGNPGLWASIFLVILLMCGGADALNVRQLTDTAWTYRQSGGDMLTISAPGGIRGRDCAALTSISGVEGAMAMRGAGAVTPIALPDAPYLSYEVTAGARQLMGITGDDGFVVSAKVGEQLGVRTGEAIVTTDGASHTVTGMFDWPNDGRLPQYSTAILLTVPVTEDNTMFDSCWVRAWPMTMQIRDALNSVVLQADDMGIPGMGSMPTPTRLNPLLAGNAPGETEYRTRITRFAVVPALLLAAAAGAAAVLQRRVELAMLRQFGATRAQTAEKMLGVALGWSLPAAAAASGLLALILAPAAGSVPDALALFADVGVRTVAGGLCGLYLGTMAAACAVSPRSLPTLVRIR